MNRDLYKLFLLVREWHRMKCAYMLSRSDEDWQWLRFCENRVVKAMESIQRMLEYRGMLDSPSNE